MSSLVCNGFPPAAWHCCILISVQLSTEVSSIPLEKSLQFHRLTICPSNTLLHSFEHSSPFYDLVPSPDLFSLIEVFASLAACSRRSGSPARSKRSSRSSLRKTCASFSLHLFHSFLSLGRLPSQILFFGLILFTSLFFPLQRHTL